MFGSIKDFASRLCNGASKLLGVVTCALVGALVIASNRSAMAALPDVGVNVGTDLTTAATDLGTTVGIVVGVIFAFVIVAAGIMWAKRGLKAK